MANNERVKARVQDWRFRVVGESSKPIVEVGFLVDEHTEIGDNLVWWTGWLTDPSSIEKTMKALVICGFQDTDLERFTEGLEGNALDKGREVRLTLGERHTKDGRAYPVAKYIDPLTSDKFEGAHDKSKLKSAAKAIDIKGAVFAAKADSAKKEIPFTRPAKPGKDGLPF